MEDSQKRSMNGNRVICLVVGTALATAGIALAATHPLWPVAQIAACVAIGCATFVRPAWFVCLFPVVLIVGDAYPLTGQLLVQESDSLLFAAFSGAVVSRATLRKRSGSIEGDRPSNSEQRQKAFRDVLPWLILGLVVAWSTVRGWMSLPYVSPSDQLSVHFACWNSIREAKGFAWGLVFALFLFLDWGMPASQVRQLAVRGILASLAYVLGVTILERVTYQSLFDLSDLYRASGPFFSMHIGDHHLDAFLVLTWPLIWFGVPGRKLSLSTVGPRILASGIVAYVTVATMSRATVFIFALQCLAIGWAVSCRPVGEVEKENRRTNFGWAAVIGVATMLLLTLFLRDATAFRERFARIVDDAHIRVEHWKSSARTLQGPVSLLAGDGFGTFPSRLATVQGRAFPPVEWSSQGGITLRSGWQLFAERLVDTRAVLRLNGEARVLSGTQPGVIEVIRAQKAMLQSLGSQSVQITDIGQEWTTFEVELPSVVESPGDRWVPQTLGFYASGDRNTMQFRATKNTPTRGVFPEAVNSSTPWFFTSDDHLAWHAKNGVLQLAVSSGLAGVLAFLWLIARVFCADSLANPIVVPVWGALAMMIISSLLNTPCITAIILANVSLATNRQST